MVRPASPRIVVRGCTGEGQCLIEGNVPCPRRAAVRRCGLSLVVTASLLALALVPLMLASGAGAAMEPSVPVVTQPEPPATTVPDTDEEGTPAEVPSAPIEVPEQRRARVAGTRVRPRRRGGEPRHDRRAQGGAPRRRHQRLAAAQGAGLFGAYDDDDLEPGDLVAECAVRTDAAGECTIGGLAPDTYYVAEIDDPVAPFTDFKRIAALNVDGGSSTDLYYDQVNLGPGETEHTRVFADRHVNPEFPAVCGVDVTLLFDLSSSISDSELADMQSAAQGFVGAVDRHAVVGGRLQLRDVRAGRAGNSNLQLTSVTDASGATTVDAAIYVLAQPGGEAQYTNWDAAFRSIVSGGGNPDAVIVLTDGDPTVYGVPAEGPVETEFVQIENGVFGQQLGRRRPRDSRWASAGRRCSTSRPSRARWRTATGSTPTSTCSTRRWRRSRSRRAAARSPCTRASTPVTASSTARAGPSTPRLTRRPPVG